MSTSPLLLLCEAIETARHGLDCSNTNLVRLSSQVKTIERHIRTLFNRLDILCGQSTIETSYGNVRYLKNGVIQVDGDIWERISSALNKLDQLEGI